MSGNAESCLNTISTNKPLGEKRLNRDLLRLFCFGESMVLPRFLQITKGSITIGEFSVSTLVCRVEFHDTTQPQQTIRGFPRSPKQFCDFKSRFHVTIVVPHSLKEFLHALANLIVFGDELEMLQRFVSSPQPLKHGSKGVPRFGIVVLDCHRLL
jgi:hypothetical protein